MLSIKEVYELFEKIGCCSFATLDGEGGVESRIAHFIAYDDEGLYTTTMTVKPFFRQMVEGGKLSVCGEYTAARVVNDENHMPHFEPGFTLRVSGDVRVLSDEQVAEKAKGNVGFNVAVHDIAKYPETRVLVLWRGHGELYDYDFNMVTRDHKILRERFAFGGDEIVAPGLRITDACIGCGACERACTHFAIRPGTPYRIEGTWCDECGNCYHACPVGAVVGKGR